MQGISGLPSVFKVGVLYIGAVIGAGFASGQEILQFFIVFGDNGLWGAVLATLLFSYLGGLVMFMSIYIRSANYKDIYRKILGRVPGRIMDVLSLAMLPGGLVVMLAGGGAVFSEHLGLPRALGTVLIALITAAVLSRGMQGVVSANAVLVPLKVAVIVLICLLALANADRPAGRAVIGDSAGGSGIHWAWSAILYVSYNMVVPVAVLSSMGRSVSFRAGVAGGILGGLTLGVVASLVVVTGLCYYPHITGYEIPLLFIAASQGALSKAALGALIWLAILTTSIADAHGFASRFAGSHSHKYRVIGAGVVALALPLSTLKFSLLVKVLYPLFGYVGLILLFAIIFIPPVKLIRRKLF